MIDIELLCNCENYLQRKSNWISSSRLRTFGVLKPTLKPSQVQLPNLSTQVCSSNGKYFFHSMKRGNWIIMVRRKLRNVDGFFAFSYVCSCYLYGLVCQILVRFFNLLPHQFRRSFYKSREASTQPALHDISWLLLRELLRSSHQHCRY